MTTQCKFCSRPAALESVTGAATNPPMCAAHLDLLVTVEFIIGRNQEPTLERVQALLASARKRSSALSIADAEVPAMLPDVLKVLGLAPPGEPLPAGPKQEVYDA